MEGLKGKVGWRNLNKLRVSQELVLGLAKLSRVWITGAFLYSRNAFLISIIPLFSREILCIYSIGPCCPYTLIY
ncbi:hypothetical protein MCCC1A01412_28235 [Bacillus anthracis]|nr:hypothetical protein DY471_28320 [Bacillus anthracis]OJD97283.1 hypothetical protein MCCC1A01412_28235 [Bacillus anthracis]